jgi:CheY-like chemotaxis protein
VFNRTARTTQNVASILRRVLIVDSNPDATRALGETVRAHGGPEIWSAQSGAKALKLAAKIDPQLIFCVFQDGSVDGAVFTRALRRSDLAGRKAAVVLVTSEADARSILACRDAGAHEYLKRPFTARDVARRIEAALVPARGWVEAVDYVGPDRRRFNSAEYPGPLKRLTDEPAPPQSVRVGEALKIIGSALAAIDHEPGQALRALRVQATDLEAAAAELGDNRLASASRDLNRFLSEAPGRPDDAELRRRAASLLSYAGREARAA